MTTNHPDPTPPPAEPAPSLRPVEELQALCDAATCGPWFVVGQPWNSGPPYVISEHPDPHYGVFVADFDPVDWTNDNAAADAEFIAAARTALPSLLAENARLAAADRENAELRASNHAAIRLIREHGDVEAERDEARTQLAAAQAQLAEARTTIRAFLASDGVRDA